MKSSTHLGFLERTVFFVFILACMIPFVVYGIDGFRAAMEVAIFVPGPFDGIHLLALPSMIFMLVYPYIIGKNRALDALYFVLCQFLIFNAFLKFEVGVISRVGDVFEKSGLFSTPSNAELACSLLFALLFSSMFLVMRLEQRVKSWVLFATILCSVFGAYHAFWIMFLAIITNGSGS